MFVGFLFFITYGACYIYTMLVLVPSPFPHLNNIVGITSGNNRYILRQKFTGEGKRTRSRGKGNENEAQV